MHRPLALRHVRGVPFLRGVHLLKVLLFVACAAALLMVFYSGGEKLYAGLFFGLLACFLGLYVASRIYRNTVLCPLCLGTILKAQSCRKQRYLPT